MGPKLVGTSKNGRQKEQTFRHPGVFSGLYDCKNNTKVLQVPFTFYLCHRTKEPLDKQPTFSASLVSTISKEKWKIAIKQTSLFPSISIVTSHKRALWIHLQTALRKLLTLKYSSEICKKESGDEKPSKFTWKLYRKILWE
jgi:hypothetical protein